MIEHMKDRVDVSFKGRVNITTAIVCLLFLMGFFVRLYDFGELPSGVNIDEAFAGYQAYSLLNYGIDAAGYHNPVYFIGCGSGMNVLNSYLMIPFIKIFGLHTWVIRLPQVIVACATLVVFYLLLKRVLGPKTATLGLFILAINPWHIMMARWGLESNLVPGFLLFGMYFFIRSLDNDKFFYASAVSYGLSLYCYSAIWPIVPMIWLCQVAYCLWIKKVSIKNKHMIISSAILVVIALPLMLFLAVNYGIIGEIKTSFMSIPKLVAMREGDISTVDIMYKFNHTLSLLETQNDGNLFNYTDDFGLYYKYSGIFIITGAVVLFEDAFMSIKNRKVSYSFFFSLQLIFSLILGMFMIVNVNRINCIHIPIIICIVVGIREIAIQVWKNFRYVIVAMYMISFISFIYYYNHEYAIDISEEFQNGVGECIEYAMQQDGNIYIDPSVKYSKVLYYSKMPAKEFVDTVDYTNYPSEYLNTERYGRFITWNNLNEVNDGVYVIMANRATDMKKLGYTIVDFGNYAVAVK